MTNILNRPAASEPAGTTPADTTPADATPAEVAHRTVAPLRRWYAVMLVGGLLGVFTAAWQTVERIAYAADPDSLSVCEINALLSCSSVFDHWQSSALGVPNSIIGLPVFAFIAAAGLAGVLGSRLSRGYLGSVLGVTLFMTGFVFWYMEQSAFDIGVLCLFCVGCLVNIVIAGIGITRVAAAEHVLGHGRADRELRLLVESRADLIAWVGLAAIVGAMLYVGLAY